jgi:uncharacterized membrane protein
MRATDCGNIPTIGGIMSVVHWHLLLNHFPVIGAIFAVLLLALAVLRRSSELGKVAFGFVAFLGAISVAVFLTGEPAEDMVEKLPGFSEAITERHEEVALIATVAMATAGALALLALGALRRRELPRWLTEAGLAAAIGLAALMGYTANLGGQVRHTEIRAGAGAGDARIAGPDVEDHEQGER